MQSGRAPAASVLRPHLIPSPAASVTALYPHQRAVTLPCTCWLPECSIVINIPPGQSSNLAREAEEGSMAVKSACELS